uniref:BTB domain-containing protein n=1 Tax=Setaria digitata TaxID=48799 RepID=A0A915PNT1_9BILA
MKIIVFRLWKSGSQLEERLPTLATTLKITNFSSALSSMFNNKLSDQKTSRLNMPRLGWRFNERKNGRVKNSEAKLPDKLAQALKALRPGVLSHVSHLSSPFKNQGSNYVAAADDVIYYPSSEQYRNKRSQRSSVATVTRISSLNNALPFQSNVEPPSTFEQIRQLYKSVPNLSTSCEESPRRAHSAIYHPNGLRRQDMYPESLRNAMHNSSPYLNKTGSPTDSGYRSAPRMPPHSGSTVLRHRRSDYCSFQQDTCHRRCERYEHFVEGVHEPTVIFSECAIPEASFPLQISYSTSSTTSSRPSVKNYDFQLSRESVVISPPKHSSSCSLTRSSIAANGVKEFGVTEEEIMEVLRRGRCKEYGELVDHQVALKLKKYLERTLYVLADEIRRLSLQFIKCRILDIKTAVKVLFSDSVADSCIKAGTQATSIYALSGSGALKTSMQRRAGLCFNLGHFYKWMIENEISEIILDEAVVFLCAVVECLLEEMILACVAAKCINLIFLLICLIHETNLTADKLSEMLDRQNNIRKVLAENNEGIIIEGQDDFTKHSHEGYLQESLLCIKSETELVKLLETRRAQRDNVDNLGADRGAKYKFPTLGEWIRISEAYALHHSSDTVDEDDVRQAARILLNIDCPPRFLDFSANKASLNGLAKNQQTLTEEIGFQLLRNDCEETVVTALDFLEPSKLRNLNAFGLTALSEAILTGNNRTANALILAAPDLNIPVPSEQNGENSKMLLIDFAGWTPLTWAAAQRNYPLTVRLIDAYAEVESSTMIKETPLQIATILGEANIVRKLLNCGANPFRTTINYDSMKCNYRHMGSPSAVALAAAYNHRDIFRMMLAAGVNYKWSEENLSLKDFLDQNEMVVNKSDAFFSLQSNTRPFLNLFNKEQQLALNEAIYYAAETSNIDIAMDLRKIGIAWNLHTWTTCLQAACLQISRNYKLSLLDDFNFRLADELTCDNIRQIATLLFEIIRSECPSATRELRQTAAIISSFYRRTCAGKPVAMTKSVNVKRQSNSRKSMIDPGYVNNPDLSDITFLVANRVFYGHRIVLMNTTSVFRKLLDDSCGPIRLDNISYDTFNLVMIYLYSGGQLEMNERPLSRQMELIEAAHRFGLNTLKHEVIKSIKMLIRDATIAEIFPFATRYGFEDLKTECCTYIFKYMSSVVEDERIRMLLRHRECNGQPDYCAELLKTFLESYENHNCRATHC